MKGKLLFLALAACLSILMCRFHFHPLLLLTIVLYHAFFLYKKKLLLFLLCVGTSVIFTLQFTYVENQNVTTLEEGPFATTSGMFSSIPTINGNQLRGNINLSNGEKLTFYYTIKTKEEKAELYKIKPGSICKFSGELVQPRSPTMPNAFDYKQYLHDHHIHWQYQLDEFGGCVKSQKDLLLILLKIRQNGLTFIEDRFPLSSEGIVQALLFGDRNMIDSDVEAAYQQLGIVHLLAISGLHVGLLVSGIYTLLIYLGLTHEKTRIILILLLPIYMIVTGAAPSVIRASFMVILYFLLKLLKKKISALDVISFTFLILLLLNPYYLFQVGFQLSYVVSFGLLFSFGIIKNFTNWLARLAIVSTIAQLLSLPIMLYSFYEVSIISVPMNMIFVPLYSLVILPLSIITSLFSLIFSSMGVHFIELFSDFLQLTHQIVLFASTLPLTTYTTGKPALLIIICLICFTVYLFLQFEKTNKLKLLARPIAYLFLILCIPMVIPYLNPYGKVLVIDVGQGDSLFIQRPFNKGNYLIDTGGKVTFPQEKWMEKEHPYSIARGVTVPYLKSLGITELDALFLTHGDYDHIGETKQLMEELLIKELIIPIGFVRGDMEQQILDGANRKKIKVKSAKAGEELRFKNFTFYVLAPSKLTDNKNDDSLTLWAKIGGLKWLFTGDVEIEGETRILSMYPTLKVDVLKLGHHGSKTSSSDAFLKQLKPSVALLSVGSNNRYQHPHAEVLERLSSYHIPLYRTDSHGGILYQFKRDAGTFSTHPP